MYYLDVRALGQFSFEHVQRGFIFIYDAGAIPLWEYCKEVVLVIFINSFL